MEEKKERDEREREKKKLFSLSQHQLNHSSFRIRHFRQRGFLWQQR
jgi:hypothetical protein